MKKLKLLVSAFMMAGLLFSTTACVDDNESPSVERMRDAKAEQLKAQAEYDKKLGEAAVINANATKALNEAQAQVFAAQAKVQEAMAKVQEAMALAAQQTNEQEKATNAIKLQEAQLLLDKAKADAARETQKAEKEFEAKMVELAAKLEQQKEQAKLDLAELKRQILDKKGQYSTEVQTMITSLMGKLTTINTTAETIAQLKLDIVTAENNITKAVVDSTVAIKQYIVGQKSNLKMWQNNLSQYNTSLAFWESYDLTKAADLKGLKANVVTAKEAKVELEKTQSAKKEVLDRAEQNLYNYLGLFASLSAITTYEPIKVSYRNDDGACVENADFTPLWGFTGCDGKWYGDYIMYNGFQLYSFSGAGGVEWHRIVRTVTGIGSYYNNENQWLHNLSNQEHDLTLLKGKLETQKASLQTFKTKADLYTTEANGHYKVLQTAKATNPAYVVTANMPSPTTRKDSLIWKADSAYYGATIDIDGIAIPVAKQDNGSKARLDAATLEVTTLRNAIQSLTITIEWNESSIQTLRNNKDLVVNNTEATLRAAIDNATTPYVAAQEAVYAKSTEIYLLEQDVALIESMYYEDQNGNQIWVGTINEDTQAIQDRIDSEIDNLKYNIEITEINIDRCNTNLANPALYRGGGYDVMVAQQKQALANKMAELAKEESKLAVYKIEKDLLQKRVDDAKQVLAGM